MQKKKMSNLKKQLKNLPSSPGVYFFRDHRGQILYIGKATSLKSRISSYFKGPINDRPNLLSMIDKIAKIDWQKTDSVLEAMFLEAKLIQQNQPPYNLKQKDDKSFVKIMITQDDFPHVLIKRETEETKEKIKKSFGPFASAQTVRLALKILRRIFPFSNCEPLSGKPCFYRHLNLCPGVCTGEISAKDYQKNIHHLILFLEGKKSRLLKSMGYEMKKAAREENFEKAAKIRDQLTHLKHIQDIALLKEDKLTYQGFIPQRIEAYDISNIFGEAAVGSLVVFTRGKIDKDSYRKFKIKTVQGANDLAMLKEVLMRRLRHPEWPAPDLIVIDGGKLQLKVASETLKKFKLNIPLIAIAKGRSRKKNELFFSPKKFEINKNLILALRDEAHRFAISYHRQLKRKKLLK